MKLRLKCLNDCLTVNMIRCNFLVIWSNIYMIIIKKCYLNDDVADICSEGEPGFDPTHMINCLKIRYEEAKRIYNKKQ